MNTTKLLQKALELLDRSDELVLETESCQRAYDSKIGEIERKLDEKERQGQEAFAQKSAELEAQVKEARSGPEAQKADLEKMGDKVRKSVKGKLRVKEAKNHPVNAKKLKEMYKKTVDTSFPALIKRLFKLGGYESQDKMAERFLYLKACTCMAIDEEIAQIDAQARDQGEVLRQERERESEEAQLAAEREKEDARAALLAQQAAMVSSKSGPMLDNEVPGYEAEVAGVLGTFPLKDEDWKSYTIPEEEGEALYLGDIRIGWREWQEQQDFQGRLEAMMPNAYQGGVLRVPYMAPLRGGLKLLAQEEAPGDAQADFIQSVCLQIMHALPMYHYVIYYLDSVRNGIDLGDLTRLAAVTDQETGQIHPVLGMKSYKVLQMGQSREQISDMIKKLQALTQEIAVILGNIPSVEDYNRQGPFVIPYQFVIVRSKAADLDDQSRESLRRIASQGKRMGISILLFTDQEENLSLYNGYDQVSFYGERQLIRLGEYLFPAAMSHFPQTAFRGMYSKSVARAMTASFNSLANDFEKFIPADHLPQLRDATDGLSIPFAINKQGRLMELKLSSSLTAHGLLSGGTGSGKTTLLHTLIASVMMHYAPDDVQLWLVDYKLAEFTIYLKERPQHIHLVGVQNSEEFTFAFLDYAEREYQRRMQLFQQATREKGVRITSLQGYRKHYGKNSLPRILIIVDEFHNMTQHIQDNEYREKLENQLSEVRACGMTYLFSDQAVSTGLRGLTDKGKKQIMVRLAMAQKSGDNAEEEIVATIGIERALAKEYNAKMDLGHVLFLQQVEVPSLDGTMESKSMLLHCRSLYLKDDVQKRVFSLLSDTYGMSEDPVLVDGKEAHRPDQEVMRAFIGSAEGDDAASLRAVLGTPANLEKCFGFTMRRNYNNNLIVVGGSSEPRSDEMRMRILSAFLLSLKMQSTKDIYLLCDENDIFYRHYSRALGEAASGCGAKIITDYGQICDLIYEMRQLVSRRVMGRAASDDNTVLIWIGLDNMLNIFQMAQRTKPLPKKTVVPENDEKTSGSGKTGDKSKDEDGGMSDLMATFNDIFPGIMDELEAEEAGGAASEEVPDEPAEEEEEVDMMDLIYQAGPDISALMMQGPRCGIFNVVTYSAVTPLLTYRHIVHVDRFVFRIAMKMDEVSSGDLMNGKQKMASSELPVGTAVYYDGGRVGRHFIPYLPEA